MGECGAIGKECRRQKVTTTYRYALLLVASLAKRVARIPDSLALASGTGPGSWAVGGHGFNPRLE